MIGISRLRAHYPVIDYDTSSNYDMNFIKVFAATVPVEFPGSFFAAAVDSFKWHEV